MFFGSWLISVIYWVSCKDNKDPVTNIDPWKIRKVIAMVLFRLLSNWINGAKIDCTLDR